MNDIIYYTQSCSCSWWELRERERTSSYESCGEGLQTRIVLSLHRESKIYTDNIVIPKVLHIPQLRFADRIHSTVHVHHVAQLSRIWSTNLVKAAHFSLKHNYLST